MIEQEVTQEIASPAEPVGSPAATGTVEPAVNPEPTESVAAVTPPVIPAKLERRSIWPNLLGALLLIIASSGITYLVVADSEPEEVVAGTESNSIEDEAAGGNAPGTAVPADEPIANAAAIIIPSVVQIQSQGGVGSGVVYDSNGLILTAAHVVAGADTVTVRFNDGEEMEGTVLGGTSGADVAVVQVDRTGLPAAELALG
jgi:S1-C subfamily serine protease